MAADRTAAADSAVVYFLTAVRGMVDITSSTPLFIIIVGHAVVGWLILQKFHKTAQINQI